MSSPRRSQVGIDVVSDGEMSKISYATYIRHRLTGFEIGEMPRDRARRTSTTSPTTRNGWRSSARRRSTTGRSAAATIRVKDLDSLHKDIANLKARGGDARRHRGVHERGFAGRDRGVPAQPLLSDAGRLYRGDRRGDARGIRGDRRGRPDPADRLRPTSPWAGTSASATWTTRNSCASAEQQVEALNHALRERAGRPGAHAPLLGQLRGPAHPRHRRSRRSCRSS